MPPERGHRVASPCGTRCQGSCASSARQKSAGGQQTYKPSARKKELRERRSCGRTCPCARGQQIPALLCLARWRAGVPSGLWTACRHPSPPRARERGPSAPAAENDVDELGGLAPLSACAFVFSSNLSRATDQPTNHRPHNIKSAPPNTNSAIPLVWGGGGERRGAGSTQAGGKTGPQKANVRRRGTTRASRSDLAAVAGDAYRLRAP